MLMFIFELLVFIKSDGHSSFNLKKSLQGIKPKEKISISMMKDLEDGVKAYYRKDENGPMEEIKGISIIGFDPPCTIYFFYTTQFCTQHQEIESKRLTLSEGDSAKTVTIVMDDIAEKCLHESKTYYINIKNDLTEKFNSKLYVQTRTGDTVVVSKNEPYQDSLVSYQAFSVKVLIETQYCERTEIATVTATETQVTTAYDDSKIPDTCIPYYVCINIELPSSYTIHYKSTSQTDEEFKLVEDGSLTLYSETTFEVQLYLSGTANCQEKYEWKKFSAAKKIQCQTLTSNDIPSNCLTQYKICFDLSQLQNDIKIGYTIDDEDVSKIKELTNPNFSNPTSFKVNLYLMKSPACTDTRKINTYFASQTSSGCIIIKNEDLPKECMGKYYIKIINKASSPYSFQTKVKNEFEYLGRTYEKEFISQVDFPIYITTEACETSEFVKNIKATTDPEAFSILTDADVPTKCFSYKICGDFSELSSDYEISYTVSYEEGTPIHELVHGQFSFTSNKPFTINYNLTKSPHCAENEVTGTLVATEPYYCIDYDDSFIPDKCRTGTDSTPAPTDIPTLTYAKETVETYLTVNSNTNLNDSLDKKFSELNKDTSNKDKIKVVNIVADSITFDYPLAEDQLINLVGYGKITYKGGNLRTSSLGTRIILSEDRKINLGFYRSSNDHIHSRAYFELVDADSNQPEVNVTINFLAQINTDAEITFPENVKNVKIDSVNFGGGGSRLKIKWEYNNLDSISAEINNITVEKNGDPYIENALIHDSITIDQGSRISLSNVEFEENAKIKYNVNYYNNAPWDYIIYVDGTIGIPEKIEISYVNDNIKPKPNWDYRFIQGKMDMSTCEKLAEIVDIENTGFSSKKCKIFGRSLSEEIYLALRNDEGTSGDGPNLGLIIGVVVGVVVAIAIVIVVVVIVIRKRKNRNSESEGQDKNADTNEI